MTFDSKIRNLVSLIESGSKEQAMRSAKSWISPCTSYYVTDFEEYNKNINEVCESDSKVTKRFARKTIREFIEKEIIRLKTQGMLPPNNSEEFFKEFHEAQSRNLNIATPISGIRLDGASNFEISVFKFGNLADLEMPIAGDHDGMYVRTSIRDVYDPIFAIEKADSTFSDLMRLIIFLSGKQDRSIVIKTGLPLLPDLSPERMYVATSSYLLTSDDGKMNSSSLENRHLEKIPVNNDFFCKNSSFSKLWEFFTRRHQDKKLSDMESRILNSALSLGESASTPDPRNSIIYTCIALETLFSFDEGSLFQKSIGEKLADLFVFVVAKDKDGRITASRLLKDVYGMRSAIVHGGSAKTSRDNLVINILLRAAICELLNNEKFKGVSKISQLYEQLRLAQYSY